MFKSNFLNFRALVMTICLALLPIAAIAQTTISGVVRETTGESIPGASVREKGTTNGAATDFDGNFSFKVSNPNATIVVSFVGYETQEIPLAGRKTLTVTLKSDDELLEDVVVVGYGTMKKKLVTGATVQVKGEDIAKMNTTNALTAMQSTTPGVQIAQASTQPGAGFKVNIRGMGTIYTSSPLLVIDGVVSGTADDGLNGINPNDIERIDVLKDAASAAIYGARAANGVILVTTKQGKEGKISIQYDGHVGWSNPYKRPATLNAQEYMSVINETYLNSTGAMPDWSGMVPATVLDRINNGWGGTDWFDEYRNKNAIQTSHAVSLTGGTDRSKFSMSINYSSNEGTLGGSQASDYKRYGGRINSDHVLLRNDKGRDIITIGENISYWYHSRHSLAESNGYWNIVQPTYSASPLVPAYDANGELTSFTKDGAGWSTDIFNNPLNGLYNGEYNGINRSRDFGVGATLYWIIEPVKGLRYRGAVNTGYSGSNYRNFSQPYSQSSTNASGTYGIQMGESQSGSIQFENTITYTLPQLGKHNIDVMVGQSFEKNLWNADMYEAATVAATSAKSLLLRGFDYAWPSNFDLENLTGFSGSGDDDVSIASFFARANWNYDEKYMATATIRRDGSSRFARGHRWGTFPSFSAGWDITREIFMENTSSWLDQFKIRASWGQNGNCEIPNGYYYLSNIKYSPTDYADFGYKFSSDMISTVNGDYKTGAYAANMPTPDLTWETSEQVDLGFDARFLNNRLGVNFDWYYKKTKDWLVAAPIEAMYGYEEAAMINGGDVRNKGFEIALSWNDRINKDFGYHVNFNIATNSNKVTRLASATGRMDGVDTNGSAAPALFENSGYIYRAEVGQPIGYFYGMSYSGIWQNEAQIEAARAAGKAVLPNAVPGDPIWDDHNGDGQITYDGDDNDRHNIGNPHPKVNIGITLGFDYKGFDFNVACVGAYGHQIMSYYRNNVTNPYSNYTKDVFDRWHGEGTSNSQPRLLLNSNNNNWISSRYVQSADYFRIQNVTLGYDFNKIWKNSPFGQLRLYVQAQNLLTFTGYNGVDPEVGGSSGGNGWASGIDLGLYPSARTYLVGVSVKF